MLLVIAVAALLLSAAVGAESLLVERVNVVSPHHASVLAGRNVLIVDGRIRQVSEQPIVAADEVPRLSGRGKYLTPGLMDSHAHVSLIPGLGFWDSPEARRQPALVEHYLRQQPRSHLYHGVTQILDPNPGLAWQRFEAAPLHPDLLRCEVLSSPETFPMVDYDRQTALRLFPYHLIEPTPQQPAPKDRTPEAVIQRLASDGAVCIKLYFEDGYGDASHWPLLTTETLARIKAAADARGLPILAHANAVDMYQQALAAGADVVVHGLWNWGAGSRGSDVPAAVKSVLDTVHLQEAGYMASQQVLAGLANIMLPEILDDPALGPVTPKPLLAWYRQPEAQWFKEELITGFDGLPPARIAAIFKGGQQVRNARAMNYLHQQGHPLLLGSDFPGSPSYANQPGLSTYREMVAMADAGIPLADILAAATINNARQFNIDGDYGTVAPGKVANLLLLKDNPLENVKAWDSIETVILHGRAIARQSLAVDEATAD